MGIFESFQVPSEFLPRRAIGHHDTMRLGPELGSDLWTQLMPFLRICTPYIFFLQSHFNSLRSSFDLAINAFDVDHREGGKSGASSRMS